MLQIILTLASARPDAFWFPNPLLPNDTALIAGSELDISSKGRSIWFNIPEVRGGVLAQKQKHEKPSPNLTTSHQGHTLKCVENTAREWHWFLQQKFVTTEVE